MTTADKLTRLKTDFDDVYNKGYEDGKAEGGDSYDEFEYIRSRGYTEYNNWFNGYKPLNGVRDLAKIMPKHTENGKSFNDMFYLCNCSSIPYFDTSNGENFNSLFNNCNFLTDIPAIDVSKGKNFTSMFYACGASEIPYLNTVNGTNFNMTFSSGAIKKLGGFNLSSATEKSFLDSTAFGCVNLEEVERIEGTIPVTIKLSNCSKLNVESAKLFITHLVNYSGTENEFAYSVIFHNNVWARLDALGNNSPNGNTWREYVNDLGWNAS